MDDFNLKICPENGNVKYIMSQKTANVQHEMPFEQALKMLAGETVSKSDKFEGFPITADGVYYFAGEFVKNRNDVDSTIELGADGFPIPATATTKKSRRAKK